MDRGVEWVGDCWKWASRKETAAMDERWIGGVRPGERRGQPCGSLAWSRPQPGCRSILSAALLRLLLRCAPRFSVRCAAAAAVVQCMTPRLSK